MTRTVTASRGSWHVASLDSPVDGIPIRYAHRQSKERPARAVIILNGRSEWIEKYSELPDWMDLGDDTLWVTMDHRGQGESGGPRAYVASYDHYAQDVAAVLEQAAGDLPYAIVSHSMGGLIALYGTMYGYLKPKALALSSPLLALPNAPLPRRLAMPLASIVAKTRYSQQPTGVGGQKRQSFANNPLTGSLAGFQLVCSSPFPYVAPSFGWVNATFSACKAVLDPAKVRDLRVPVRIIGGSDEMVVDAAGWSHWCTLAAKEMSAPVEFFRISGGRHELLNEVPRIRQRAVLLLRSWLIQYLFQSTLE